MAKQITACFSRSQGGKVRVAGLTFALMVALCPGHALRAADSLPSDSPTSNTTLASLEYQETSYGIINGSVSLRVQTGPFKKEPGAAAGKIIRGVLNFGPGSSNAISFLWQRDAGKLYLDLNHNQDLTDDPAGVFVTPVATPFRQFNYQTFTNVHLLFNTASGRRRVLADLNLYDFGARLTCFLMVRSFWQGKLTLHGRDWQAGLVQNVADQTDSIENSRLLLRPWEKRDQPFNADNGLLATVPFSRKLFVDGQAYQLAGITRSQDGQAIPSLQFTEQSVALGEVKITGQFIRRLVLPGGPYLVILDQPAGVVKIPAGTYNQPEILLEQNGVQAFCNKYGPLLTGGQISVGGKTAAVLAAGGPLTNSVTANRHGQDLLLNYCLLGAGGESYQLANQDRSKPPAFAIYKGAKKIASGAFEFG